MVKAKLGLIVLLCFIQEFAVNAAKDGLCPRATSGACVVSCGQDEDCDGDKKCCNNGCGATCVPAVCPPGVKKADCPAQLCNYVGCPGVSSQETTCKIRFCGGCKVTFHNKTTGALLDCGEEETLCKRMLAATQRKPMLGQYKPKCDENGHFQKIQCHEAFCFCVDPKTGVPEMSTRVQVPKRPKCRTLTTCQQKQKDAMKLPPIGRFVPSCKADGSFSKTQCHSSTGQCWCVDSNGFEWQGTRMQAPKRPNCLQSVCAKGIKMLQCDPVICQAATCAGNDKAVCRVNPCGKCRAEFLDEYGRLVQCLSKCQKLRKEALESSGLGHTLVGHYIPQCTGDGKFQQVQCYGSTGYCWCVNDQGIALQANMTRGIPNCNKTSENVCPGGIKPFICLRNFCKWATCASNPQAKCEVNLCKACKVEFYDKDRHLVDCKKDQTPCQLERSKALAQSKSGEYLVGQFVPECTVNGSYERVQCWASTGYCWCTDSKGNEEKGTRTRGKPECSSSNPSVAPVVKVGFCSPVITTSTNSSCSNSCQSDSECEGNKKCCNNGCGGKSCRTPLLTGCANGKPYLLCLHLCQFARCPAFPEASCTADPCNMCKVEFHDKNQNPVNCSQGLTPCQFESKRAVGLLGHFVPQCAKNGSFEPVQCHEGYCWCVDKDGREKNNTRQRAKPSCSSGDKENALTPCQRQRSVALGSSSRPLVGAFIPFCTPSGEFSQTQCRGSTGYCWCVDKTGTEIAGTRVRFRRPDCSRKPCRPVGCNLFCYHGYQKGKDGCEICKCNPMPAKPGSCPLPAAVGTCIESCSLDADCRGKQKCCSNGCGHTCQDPIFQGTRPGFCAALSHTGLLGACLSKCSWDDDCVDPSQKCCSNGCGRFCTSPIREACPGGVPLLRCFVDPCQRASCPAYPKARCRVNYCGRCAAEFYDEDNIKVNCTKARTKPVSPVGPTCSNGGVYTLCTQDLCHGSSGMCPRSPRARCIMPLGGCDASICQQPSFFKTNGKAVECRPCQQKARNVSKSRLVGAYIPQCNPDGTYKSIQCHASTAYCWCADPDGTEWPGTSVRFSKPLQCERSKGPEVRSVSVQMVFDMDFGNIRNILDNFTLSLKNQIAQRFQLSVEQIVDLKVVEGSIKVSFHIKRVNGGRDIGNLSQVITEEIRRRDFIVYFGGMNFVAGPEEVVAASQYESGDDKDTEKKQGKGLAPKYIAIIVIITLLIVGAVAFIVYKLVQRRRTTGGYTQPADQHVLYKTESSS